MIPRLLGLLLVLISTPLLAMKIGPEIRVSDPAIEPSVATRWAPRIASNGDGFLAVWYDGFDGTIRGARLDRLGVLIDRRSFVIASTVLGLTADVASNGRDYAVAYRCDDGGNFRTCVASVSAATGMVTRGAAIAKATNASIASNGNDYLVAYHFPDRNDLWAIEVSADATTLGTPLQVTTTGTQWPPAIASNGDRYLIVSANYTQIYATLVSPHEVIRGSQPISSTAPVWGATAFGWSVASDGNGFMVVWQQNLGLQGGGYVTELRARPAAADGTLATEITIPIDRNRAWYPAVAWSGSKYEVAYSTDGSWPQYLGVVPAAIGRVALGPSANIVDGPAVTSINPDRANPAIASDGETTVVVSEQRSREDRIEITADRPATGESQVLSNSVAWQQSMTGAQSGDNSLLAWEELVGPSQRHEIRLQRIDAQGVARDARGIAVSPGDRDQVAPALSSSAVAWIEQKIAFTGDAVARARRLSGDGEPAGAAIDLGAAARDSRISVDSNASQSLVVWQSPQSVIVAVRIAHDGTPLDTTPFAISNSSTELHSMPIVKTEGTNFLVVWQTAYWLPGCMIPEGCPPAYSLHSALVTASGAIGQRADLSTPAVWSPFLLWNGEEFVAFYSRMDPDSIAYTFNAQKIDRNGVPLWGGPAAVETNAMPVLLDAAWDGRDYLVAYQEMDGFHLAKFDANFNEIDRAPLGRPLTSVAIVPRDPNLALLAYTTPVDAVSRAVARFVGEGVNLTRRRAVGPR